MSTSSTALPPKPTLTIGTYLAYGSSAFGENLTLNAVVQLAYPIFNLVLGVSPMLIGLALALPRLWDAVADPWMGSISDNYRSRWGRRRPFVVAGAVLTALCATTIWQFPEGKSPDFYFWWLLGGSLCMATAYTIFTVPYGALGLELTADYHERTTLMAVKSAFSKTSGLVNQWLFKLVQLGIFSGMLAGARYMGAIVGLIIVSAGLITGTKVRERPELALRSHNRLSLWRSWKETMRQRDFGRLVAAQVFIYTSVLLVDNIGFYLNVFYVNGGDLKYAAIVKGVTGSAFQICGILSIPLIAKISRRIGKQRAFLACTGTIMLGGIAKWYCYVPGAGWWIVLPSVLLAPGLVAVMVLVPSMTADICDVDEMQTHARREGMYNAVAGWLMKLSGSVAIFGSGLLLTLVGWRSELAAIQPAGTFFAMRVTFCLSTVVLALLAALMLRGYRVNEAMVLAARSQVESGRSGA